MNVTKVILRRAAEESADEVGTGGTTEDGQGASGGEETGRDVDESGLRRSPIVASGAASAFARRRWIQKLELVSPATGSTSSRSSWKCSKRCSEIKLRSVEVSCNCTNHVGGFC